jgi:hypothetical protein
MAGAVGICIGCESAEVTVSQPVRARLNMPVNRTNMPLLPFHIHNALGSVSIILALLYLAFAPLSVFRTLRRLMRALNGPAKGVRIVKNGCVFEVRVWIRFPIDFVSVPGFDTGELNPHLEHRQGPITREGQLATRDVVLPESSDIPAGISDAHPKINQQSAPVEKIALFRSLFRGREDVYPQRFVSRKTGRAGYSPACGNEWMRGVCEKPKIKCSECPNQCFLRVTDEIIRQHLSGRDENGREFVMGVYPMLLDETCHFLAVDFDGDGWQEDTSAFGETCRRMAVPFALERSRSGEGGHVWFFFAEAVPATTARNLGSYLITETMEAARNWARFLRSSFSESGYYAQRGVRQSDRTTISKKAA